MKKKIYLIGLFLLFSFFMVGCKDKGNKDISCAVDPTQDKCEYMPGVKLKALDSTVVGRYELSSISENAVTYEYNYLLLLANGEYETHVKTSDSDEKTTKGAVFYSENTLTFKFYVNNVVTTSTAQLENNKITFTEVIGITTVTLIYEKK